MRCLSPEEEITRIRPRHFHEIEARVHLNADAFKRHQSAHNETEGAGRCNRIFINYISQLVGELFEVHLSEVQIDLALEHIFHKRAELGHIELSMEKAERNEIIYKSAEIALENVEEGRHHLLLQLLRDKSDHAEIEESEPPVVHNKQIARMRICVEEAVLEQLLEIGPMHQLIQLFG